MPNPSTLRKFRRRVRDFYKEHGRHALPWRKTRDPYKILVSEVMLQQTQVERVRPFYAEFTKRFPTIEKLAEAKTRDVLTVWQGLGYNRRAINLKRTAEIVTKEYGGKLPRSLDELLKLPGVGRATAGDLIAFAWNDPAIVIETNIRTVFIHHFFKDKGNIPDAEILPLIEATLDRENPRDWYYALMDYGAHLKRTLGNNAHRSKHYKKQSKFKGSNRELRSNILKLVLLKGRTEAELVKLLDAPAASIQKNLLALCREGLLRKNGRKYSS